jgi:hypothetical protein
MSTTDGGEPQLGQLLAAIQQLQVQQQQIQQTQVQQQNFIQQQMQQQALAPTPAQQMQQQMPQQMAQEAADIEDEDTEMEDDNDAKMLWEKLLGSDLTDPTTNAAQALVQSLQNPPPLGNLKSNKAKSTLYRGVPEAAPPRKHRVDFSLWQSQQKMEMVLHNLIELLETGERNQIGVAAAWARSAWQDLHEQRRRLLAGGKGANFLERRPDEQKTRLLTPQEEEKIQRAKRPLAKAKNAWGSNDGPKTFNPSTPTHRANFRGRPRSRSQPGGKGKGGKMQN